jgi:plastocyanin
MQGTGALGGVGVLLDEVGDNDYTAPPPMPHEPGASGLIHPTGSQGFGDGGFGILLHLSGRGHYTGMPDRGPGRTVAPSDSSTGLFYDAGSGRGFVPGLTGATVAGPMAPAADRPGGLTAFFTHYIPDTVTVEQGAALQFFNPDLYGGPFGGKGHFVTERRSDGESRFDSFVAFGTSSAIDGVSALSPGSYPFYCKIHPFMRGTLIVRGPGSGLPGGGPRPRPAGAARLGAPW